MKSMESIKKMNTKKSPSWKPVLLGKALCCLLCFLMTLSLLPACKGNNDVTSGAGVTDFPVTINGVTISSEPQGVAVLSPNLAEIVLALGYETKLKARCAECTTEELNPLPAVSAGDAQAIKDTGSTLVLADETLTEEQKETLSSSGLTVLIISSAKDREDLKRLYSQVGAALMGGATGYEKGERVANNVLITLDDIERVIPSSDTPVTACYLTDLNGGAITGDSIQSRIFESAGLVNVATDSKDGTISDESLKASNPNYIFCITGLKDTLMESDKYKDLTAVKEGQVYEMPYSYIAYQGRGMIRAATFMAGTAYPELLESDTLSSVPSSSSSSSGGSGDPSDYTTLKSGDSGDAVMRLQERLAELGYFYVNPTGNYLDVTVQCVKDFQLLNGMATTGIADEETQALLFSDKAVPRNASSEG